MKPYRSMSDLTTGDCVIGLAFGTSTNPGSVNAQLANLILKLADGRPTIADLEITEAIENGGKLMTHTVGGYGTSKLVGRTGTWGTLLEIQRYMEDNGLGKPIVIAHAYHVSRVVRQAAKLGLPLIVPAGLPTDFDKSGKQFWTRSVFMWVPVNALGSLLLQRQSKL